MSKLKEKNSENWKCPYCHCQTRFLSRFFWQKMEFKRVISLPWTWLVDVFVKLSCEYGVRCSPFIFLKLLINSKTQFTVLPRNFGCLILLPGTKILFNVLYYSTIRYTVLLFWRIRAVVSSKICILFCYIFNRIFKHLYVLRRLTK